MIKKIFVITICLLYFVRVSGQNEELNIKYLAGIYKTKDAFLNKEPTHNFVLKVEKIELVNYSDTIIRRCYFRNKETNKKIKNAFAISYKGNLYFQSKAILEYKNNEDISLSVDKPKSFVLVLFGGENYLYTEAGVVNHWKAGVSAGVAVGVGGFVGDAISTAINDAYSPTTFYGKPVVWDIKKREFNILRNCKDTNAFFENLNIDKIDCNKDYIRIEEIRTIIDKIK